MRQMFEVLIGRQLRVDDVQNFVNQFGNNSIINRGFTKREFIKLSAIIGVGGINFILNGCATSPDIEDFTEGEKVIYPKLIGNKIQSPEHYGLNGCLTGLFLGGNPTAYVERVKDIINRTGKKPTFVFVPHKSIKIHYSGTTIDSIIYERNKSYKIMSELEKKV